MPRALQVLGVRFSFSVFRCSNGVRNTAVRSIVTHICVVLAVLCTAVLHCEAGLTYEVDPLHAHGFRSLAWMLMGTPVGVLLAGEGEDSLRINSGDPTNTDLPRFTPPQRLRRYDVSGTRGFGPIPKGYRPESKVDSLLRSVLVRETIDGLPIGVGIPVDLDDFLKRRVDATYERNRDSSLNSYEIKRNLSGTELSKLIDQATNITIPLPPNPVFSIFGKPEVSINVNGEVNVQAGWRWDTQNLGTASVLGQTQSAPIFTQNIQVNVGGRIGDKLRLNVDWNTLNQFEFNNRFKIGYEGYDDDIVKRVEFGNVNLETPSTLIGGGQALFGVRSDYQFGPLYLKTLLSQRRAERRFVNARGGSSRSTFNIRAYNYARNHFFIDTAYFGVWRDYYRSATPALSQNAAPLVVKEIEVWESTGDVRDVQAVEALAIDTLPGVEWRRGQRYPAALRQQPIRVGFAERGRFMRLDQRRYVADLNLGTVSILNFRPDRTYAVSYRIEGPTADTADDVYYGNLTSNSRPGDTLMLKLIARPQLQPGFRTIWKRQMRNRYAIGASNVNAQDARIGMWYFRNTNDSTDVLAGAPDKIVTIFRVDQVNNGTGAAPPDGVFDARPPLFDAQRGEITFPSLEPFREGIRDYFRARGNADIAEQYVFNEIYDTTDVAARLVTAKDRFVISAEASGTVGNNRLQMGFNVAPGSVRATLDGLPLREGTDYTVDYYSGSITLLNPRATLPNANLNVEFEQNDVFNLTTRTLAGLRADMLLYNKRKISSSIGMTMMNFDQAAIVDQVQPGAEPNANFMLGFDTKLNAELPWLTKLLDDLPLFSTKEKSNFTAQGEWALVAPTPNKRLSTIVSDAGKGVAYLDNFEAAKRVIPFGTGVSIWSHASAPDHTGLWPDDTTAGKYRARTFWYQKFVPDVPQADVYPNRARIQGRANINPLRFAFEPTIRGIHNNNPQFLDPGNPRWNDPDSLVVRAQTEQYLQENKYRTWGGMMRFLPSFSQNLDNENVEFIEIFMRVEAYEPGQSKLYIDLGQISEDVIGNQRLNTEDRFPPNNNIEEGEDVGIDTLSNALEQTVYPEPLNRESDPARDDYFFDFSADRTVQQENQFIRYNNYEGNATQAELGRFPDTEILNRNNGQTISLDNSYFRYEINLTPDPASNPQIVGGNPDKGWFQYRIPIRRPDSVVGSPLFTNVQYVRLHAQGGTVKLQIAEWGMVGTFWLRSHSFLPQATPQDSVMQVAYVNREENSAAPDFYTMPPSVQPPRQLQNPDPNQDIFFNEQSLVVNVRSLRYGEERMTVRTFNQTDIFFYRELAFFIHGDQTMPERVVAGSVPPAYCFIRFGIDSANYYEYRRPLVRGWQDLRIIMAELTAIKQVREGALRDQRQEFPVPNDPLAVFAIKGSPILTRLNFVGFGVANPAERFPNELSTSMWVNELRLVDPVDDVDWAAVGSATLKLADLGDITMAYNHTAPNFHKLEERFGNRRAVTNWNVNVNVGLEKFLPNDLKSTKIPITYSHAEIIENPQFQAQNDVELERAAEAARLDTIRKGASADVASSVAENVRRASQTVIVRDQWAITGLKLGIPSKAWYIDDTFNKLTINYNYAQEFQRSQIVENRFDWRWQLRLDYAVTLPAKYDVKPLTFLDGVFGLKAYKDMKINFLPTNIALALDMQRQRITEQSRFLDFPSPVVRNFQAQKTGSFTWKLVENGFLSPVIDYKVMAASTLVPLELDRDGRQRTGGELFGQMFGGNGFFNFGDDNTLQQTVTVSMRPRLPEILGLNRFIETTGSYSVTYNWFDPLQPDPVQRDIVKTARYNSSLRFSPVFRWRQFGNEIFGAPKKGAQAQPQSLLKDIGDVVQEVIFGFENLTMLFNQTNNATNNGVMGGTGFSNLWARSFLFRSDGDIWGPSTAYQLGLVSNPHGSIQLAPSSAFPFFRFESTVGLRPPNGVMQDDYSQRTSLTLQTSRPLWPGATLDLQMKSDFGFSRNQRVVTDALGVPTFTNVNQRETLERSFISIPSWFIFSGFGDNMQTVVDLYAARRAQIEATTTDETVRDQRLREALSESFLEGFESLQLFTGRLAKIMPALNWTFRWDGIEKIGPLKGIANRVYLEHAYTSTYTENARVNDNGRVVEVQQVQTGFKPLIGVTANFDEKALNGTLTGSLRYNITTAHNFNAAAGATVQRDDQQELQIQASYLRRRVSLKFLGFDLENDMEFTFLTQIRRSFQRRYDIENFKPEGDIVQGTTQITIEPRARYTISNRVTASAFFRYEGNFNEGASNPGFSTTQVGVDIRLSISGGR